MSRVQASKLYMKLQNASPNVLDSQIEQKHNKET